MKILISAAEASSDIHGAALLKALRTLCAEVEAFGTGGPHLQAAGLEAVVDAKELLAMGITEVLGRLPKILTALKTLEQAAVERKPDLAVVIDYPDFHFKLARRLKKLQIPVVYYIPPKVWVWRKKRVKFLKENFAKVLCVFPFEQEFYRKADVAVTYVGNPLIDELPLTLSRAEAREKLGLTDLDRVLVLMLGSRPAELKRHLDPMLEGAVRAAARLRSSGFLAKTESLKVLIPLPETTDFTAAKARVDGWLASGNWANGKIVEVRVSQGNSATALLAGDAGLIKSGTSTLEAALLGCPHTVVYKPSYLTGWVFQNIVRYRGPVGLVNLVSGLSDRYVAREILCSDVTASAMAGEVVSLFTDEKLISRMRADFKILRESLIGDSLTQSPSQRAAREVIEVATRLRAP